MESLVGPALVAVIISSIVTVIGWFVAHGSERRIEAARREETIQDFQTALLADIRSTTARFASFDYDLHLDQVSRLIDGASAERPFTPFVPREPGSLLWPSVAGDVHILPTEIIEPSWFISASSRQFGSSWRTCGPTDTVNWSRTEKQRCTGIMCRCRSL